MEIFLIRHGKTMGNLYHRYIGTTDEPVLEEEMEKLKSRNWPDAEAVFESPLLRCRQTAEIICPGRPVRIIDEFAECDFGSFENKNWQELKEERKMCEALRELFVDDLRESREEGIMEGRNVGKREGEASKVIEIVIKKYKKGCSVKETADMLEEPQTLIKQIYDVIGQCAPDYNVEAIYKILLDKTI